MVNLEEGPSPSTGNLPWVEKYRPSTLDELVSHKEIIKTITRLIDEDKLPHLLFYGPPGTGKTSTILAAARAIYKPSQMNALVLELNASDDRDFGIGTGPSDKRKAPIKLIILDEADAMTKDAQIIEKYTESTRFCIICNYLSKIIPALQSRCTRFRFAPLSKDQVLPRLNYIIEQEKIKATESGKEALFKLSNGDMRRVINVLQSTSLALMKSMRIQFTSAFETAYEKLNEQCQQHGIALADILDELLELITGIDMPQNVASLLMDKISQIETRLASGCSEKIQLLALISAFTDSKELLFKNFES
uniref:AAA+ ATPase domain-containing protein n=1 Tax=Ditylenchus dipsaci TaxID=166011 RepID=A0A915E2N0_9BILA